MCCHALIGANPVPAQKSLLKSMGYGEFSSPEPRQGAETAPNPPNMSPFPDKLASLTRKTQ
jgi:hypothetical protein